MTRHWSLRGLRWATRVVVGLGLVLLLAAAGLWWWAGQEGSLEWVLQRVARGQPLETEGVTGSVRSGWRIQRLAWERDGLRLEVEDVALEWQPLALLERTLRLDEVKVGVARVIDQRRKEPEPFRLPESLALPWRVVVDEVAVGRIEYKGATEVQAAGLAGGYAFDGLRHRLALKSLQFAGGEYRGEGTLQALGDMTLDAQVAGRLRGAVPGGRENVAVEFDARAQGPLADFQAQAQLRAPRASGGAVPHADARAQVRVAEPMPLVRGNADFRAIDLAQFWPDAPATSLSGTASVVPAGTATFHLRADVRNAQPGPWDAGRLPVAGARVQGEWRDGVAIVQSLTAQAGGGRIEGSGGWHGDKGWNFRGEVAAVDPAQLHSALAALPLSGPIKLEGEGEAVDFDVALTAGRARARPARGDTLGAAVGALELREATAKGRWADGTVSLAPLRVRTSDALLEGNVRAGLQARSVSGELQLRAPGLQAQARGDIAETRGQGALQVQAADFARMQQWLQRWPGLRETLANLQLRGSADASLDWQGGWRDPSVRGRVLAKAVQWQAPASGADAPLPWVLREADLRVDGRLRDAALELRALAERGQRKVEVAVGGRLGGTLGGAAASWRGQVAQLGLQLVDPAIAPGPWLLQLQKPVDWRVAGSNFELTASSAVLRAPALRSGVPATDAVIAWEPVRRQGDQWNTIGSVRGLPMAWIELVGGPQWAGSALAGDMVFDAQWNAQWGRTIRLDASLVRVRGDVTVLAEGVDGAAARVSAGVRAARVTLSNQGEQVTLALLWDSERAGRAEGQVRTRLVRAADGSVQWPEDAPLAGGLKANLPRIGVWSLLAPPGWRLRGSLDADITIGGTRALPSFSGPVNADDLALRSVVDGIELRNGRLRTQLAGQKLVVNEFLLRGSDEGGSGGTLVAHGEGQWTPQGPLLQVDAQLSQLRASIRSDRELTVSGQMAARMDRAGVRVEGKLAVDRARIVIPDETPPRLGDDVVVRNSVGVPSTEAERKLRPAPTDAGRTATLAISISLGDDFRVSGRGIDTRLAGALQVQGRSLAQPSIEGSIRTVGGFYEAYGQRLVVERGEIRFTGQADNPALDILAIRPNLTPRVGVLVSGRAQSPHVELYSEAGLPEAETLSWLVLGRGSAGGGADVALLQRAATALLSKQQGSGKGILGKIGLDDLSFRDDASEGTVVRLGKRFADNFYAAYERSLSGAVGTLYIFYDISSRLTVRASAGDRAGVDLIFTFYLDRGGARK